MNRIYFKFLALFFLVCTSAVAGYFAYDYSKADFKTIAGQKHHWRALQGDWVVVNYFAEWCAPCLREVPELNEFHQQISSKPIQLFAVSFDNEPDDILLNLQQKYAMDFPVISSEKQHDLKVPRPNSLPATYIISPEGEVKKRLLGEQTAVQLLAVIEQLKGL
ncbi:MAG: TlpA family protein disulfide reductase [Aestuariibacter sp.]